MSDKKSSFDLSASIAELEVLERYFQNPDMNLEEAIVKHKEALELSKKIIAYLNTVESTLKQINVNELKNQE